MPSQPFGVVEPCIRASTLPPARNDVWHKSVSVVDTWCEIGRKGECVSKFFVGHVFIISLVFFQLILSSIHIDTIYSLCV
jgi:hypothetical protein